MLTACQKELACLLETLMGHQMGIEYPLGSLMEGLMEPEFLLETLMGHQMGIVYQLESLMGGRKVPVCQ